MDYGLSSAASILVPARTHELSSLRPHVQQHLDSSPPHGAYRMRLDIHFDVDDPSLRSPCSCSEPLELAAAVYGGEDDLPGTQVIVAALCCTSSISGYTKPLLCRRRRQPRRGCV